MNLELLENKPLDCKCRNHLFKIGYCKYCHKGLCQECVVKWSYDIYGNEIENFKDFLLVCQRCTILAEKFVIPKIKEILQKADESIIQVVAEFQMEMAKE